MVTEAPPFDVESVAVVVTVRRMGTLSRTDGVDYVTAGGTAREGYDYVMASGTLRSAALQRRYPAANRSLPSSGVADRIRELAQG